MLLISLPKYRIELFAHLLCFDIWDSCPVEYIFNMAENNIKREYFEKEDTSPNLNLKKNLDYKFFSQENEEVELEITSDSH
jgi:hypothetical protein